MSYCTSYRTYQDMLVVICVFHYFLHNNLTVIGVQQIQPQASTAQLQAVADALNGSPEAQCRNITLTEVVNATPNSFLGATWYG